MPLAIVLVMLICVVKKLTAVKQQSIINLVNMCFILSTLELL